MTYQTLIYNQFSNDIQRADDTSIDAILKTIENGLFPGSQLYLYFRLHTDWTDSLDPSEFITDTAFIYKYELPSDKGTRSLLNKYFNDSLHIANIFNILNTSWSRMDASGPCLKPYA